MADQQVKNAQIYVNSFSNPQIPKVEENGLTSWDVMYALTRVLQSQLGIATLSNNFGNGTLSALNAQYPLINDEVPGTVLRTIQAALYCKGYDGANMDGKYSSIAGSISQLKTDMGFSATTNGTGLTPKMVKGLMTMDPYVLISGGDEKVRAIQQWMNSRYINRASFYIIPCDGHFSRDVQKALMFAIQYQIGMSDDIANGVFGPGTQTGIRNNPVSVGSSGTWVQLYSAALVFNRRPGAIFTSSFTSSTASVTSAFQSFAKLSVTGRGDFQTWASLLVSTGDPSRPGTAADCVTQVTAPRAQALKAAGYTVVGRYLSNVPNTSLNKKIQDGELATIVSNGLRVFPIYQTFGGSADYFSATQGASDAFAAIERARHYGFRAGTRIYFAVDFDALDYQISNNVIPHFRGIRQIMSSYAAEYPIGIYGPRNACSRVAAEGLTSTSFVSDMSVGFSGNLGYPLPQDWAFDQIATIGVGSGDGYIEIDKNVSSGRDLGQNSFSPPQTSDQLDVPFDRSKRTALLTDIRSFLESVGIPEEGGYKIDPDGKLIDEDVLTYFMHSTTESVDKVLEYDETLTAYARTFRMRKAVLQALLLKEYREYNELDPLMDQQVRLHYMGAGGLLDDCSTGLCQIKSTTSINAHNYCVDSRIINEPRKSDVWAEWQKLSTDDRYNLEMLPRVVIHAGVLVGVGRPTLTFSDSATRQTFQRFNGLGEKAVDYGHQLISIYHIFEKYNAPIRSI